WRGLSARWRSARAGSGGRAEAARATPERALVVREASKPALASALSGDADSRTRSNASVAIGFAVAAAHRSKVTGAPLWTPHATAGLAWSITLSNGPGAVFVGRAGRVAALDLTTFDELVDETLFTLTASNVHRLGVAAHGAFVGSRTQGIRLTVHS